MIKILTNYDLTAYLFISLFKLLIANILLIG